MEKICELNRFLLKNTNMSPRSTSDEDLGHNCIKQASCDNSGKMLIVDWIHDDIILSTDSFPYVWLRDNCQCRECYHEHTGSRTMTLQELKLDVFPLSAKINDDSQVSILWSDHHESQYKSQWLYDRRFRKQNSSSEKSSHKLGKAFWNSSFKKRIPRANFPLLMENDSALLQWLQQLEVYGVVLIDDVPMELGQVKRLADRVGFIRESHYGADFIIKVKNYPSHLSCSCDALQLHSDCSFMEYKPGITMMHCIVQNRGNGGESLIVDAVKVAKDLRDEDPEMFKILAQIPIKWKAKGAEGGREYHKVFYNPVISLDRNGEICRVDFCQYHRGSNFDIDANLVPIWYKAMKTFSDMLHHPHNLIEFKLKQGTMMTFDNLRLLHGRSSYKGGQQNRIMEACFLDWDEARSKRRILENSTGTSSDHLQ